MKVVFLPEVRKYLKEVSLIMYEKKYFNSLNASEEYMEELINKIITTIQNRQKKPAPSYFDRFGKNMFYSAFRKNKSTIWYVFFNIYQEGENITYSIRYISNNHIIAQYL